MGRGGRDIQGLEMGYSGAWGIHKPRVYDVLWWGIILVAKMCP
jgi:hypothetical protein